MTTKIAEVPLDKLPDSRAFDRDPEQWNEETLADAERRLEKIKLRYIKEELLEIK